MLESPSGRPRRIESLLPVLRGRPGSLLSPRVELDAVASRRGQRDRGDFPAMSTSAWNDVPQSAEPPKRP